MPTGECAAITDGQFGNIFQLGVQHAGTSPTDMKRLRKLEDEHSRLRKIVADLALNKEMLHELLPVSWSPGKGVSETWERQ